MADQYEVECPMPDCTEPLCVTFTGCWTLSPEDIAVGAGDVPTPVGAHTATWEIECCAGHTVLLPSESPGCPVEDATDEPCPHEDGAHDFSEDNRTLRAEDVGRLRALTERLAAR